jgi:AcrR family transcriptional regulator
MTHGDYERLGLCLVMSSRDREAGTRSTRSGLASNGPSGVGRARVVEIQRARLVSAMVEIAREQGLVGATVARVSARAGVSRRTFYELFKDREDCFLSGFDEGVVKASRCVLEAYDPQSGWAERIRASLASLLSFLDVERGAGQLLVVGSLGAGPNALERRQRVLAQMIAAVDQGRKQAKAGAQPPPLTAEGVVGGALSVIHARLISSPLLPTARGPQSGYPEGDSLLGLLNPLMGMIVLPYLGSAAARKELQRLAPKPRARVERPGENLLRDLDMRLTYRTVRVLTSIAAEPGSSNRDISLAAGIPDQGQISKLLGRLERLGLVDNQGLGKGAPNAWTLTAKGVQVEQAMRTDSDRQPIATNSRSRR